MADRKKKNLIPPKPPKNNYQIWLVIVLILLIVGLTYFNKNSSTIDITMKRFEKLMQDGDIKEVTLVINKRIVEVTLTENALRKQRISDEINNRSPFSISQGPQYQILLSAHLSACLLSEGKMCQVGVSAGSLSLSLSLSPLSYSDCNNHILVIITSAQVILV